LLAVLTRRYRSKTVDCLVASQNRVDADGIWELSGGVAVELALSLFEC
jgi:hypothetical protein